MTKHPNDYEKRVRRLCKTIDSFFEMRGMNAEDLNNQLRWLNAYHENLDKKRRDIADKLQKRLF